MKRKIIITDDGSSSLQLINVKEQYHSTFGAIQEARFVYIKKGLNHIFKTLKNHKNLAVLEMGFGTGLNAFLTYLYAKKHKININYTGIEAYPLSADEVLQLNYVSQLNVLNEIKVFADFHSLKPNEIKKITANFKLTFFRGFLENFESKSKYNLIYFDAFSPGIQPELWTEAIFNKMFNLLNPQGVLVTYSAKGQVRRNMQEVGFTIERLPGPTGKREMLRATKV